MMVQGWLGIKHHDMLQMDGVSMDLNMDYRDRFLMSQGCGRCLRNN